MPYSLGLFFLRPLEYNTMTITKINVTINATDLSELEGLRYKYLTLRAPSLHTVQVLSSKEVDSDLIAKMCDKCPSIVKIEVLDNEFDLTAYETESPNSVYDELEEIAAEIAEEFPDDFDCDEDDEETFAKYFDAAQAKRREKAQKAHEKSVKKYSARLSKEGHCVKDIDRMAESLANLDEIGEYASTLSLEKMMKFTNHISGFVGQHSDHTGGWVPKKNLVLAYSLCDPAQFTKCVKEEGFDEAILKLENLKLGINPDL